MTASLPARIPDLDPNRSATYSHYKGRTIATVASSSILFRPYSISQPLSETAKGAISKLNSFRKLQFDWNSYKAIPPSLNAIERAKKFIREGDAEGLVVYFTAPGSDGEILVELKKDGKEAELYFNLNGTEEIFIYQNDDCIFKGDLQKSRDILLENFT